MSENRPRLRADARATGDSVARPIRVVAVAAAAWALLYAIYRGYYALGGTVAIPGALRPGAAPTYEMLNGIAAAVLLIGTIGPFVMLSLRRTRLRILCIVACWIVAVGCVMHALIDMTQRVLSLLGVLHMTYPGTLWASIYQPTADFQDLFANEPWFLVEGVLIGALGAIHLAPRYRRLFLLSGLAAIAAAVTVGLLAATGHLPRVIVGAVRDFDPSTIVRND